MPAARDPVQPRPAADAKDKPPRPTGAGARAAGGAAAKPRPAFASKTQPPSADEFGRALDPAEGKRFEGTRSFLSRQKGVEEDVFFYGPQTGWGLRYRDRGAPLCALLVSGQKPFAVVAMTKSVADEIEWSELADATQRAKLEADGTQPGEHFWLDLHLDAKGHNDLRVLVKARLTSGG